MNFKELVIDSLFSRVHVWVSSDFVFLDKAFYDKYGRDFRELGIKDVKCTTVFNWGGGTVVAIVIPNTDLGVLIHELNHAFYFLCKMKDLPTNFESQEWHSYYLQWFFNFFKDITTYQKIGGER